MNSLLFALTITLVPIHFVEPRVRSQEHIVPADGGESYDHYVVENPKKFSVLATLHCGSDWDTIKLKMKAGEKVELDVYTPGKKSSWCWVSEWKEVL